MRRAQVQPLCQVWQTALWLSCITVAICLGTTAVPAQEAPAAPGGGIAPSRADAETGEPYLLGDFTDWQVRCVRGATPSEDRCEMTQTLFGADGSATAEVNLFAVRQGEVAAGATMITPLETLLPRNVTFRIDDGDAKQYPFTFCSRQGCVAQVGFLDAEVDAMRRGQAATLTIFPVQAPNQQVDLAVSLSGFTAAFDAMSSVVGGE